MPTKDELELEIVALKSQVEELQSQLNARDAIIAANPSSEGWMISAANPRYTGYTAGLRFENGRAFVQDPGGAESANAAARVQLITQDFGYRSQRITRADFESQPEAQTQPTDRLQTTMDALMGANKLGA